MLYSSFLIDVHFTFHFFFRFFPDHATYTWLLLYSVLCTLVLEIYFSLFTVIDFCYNSPCFLETWGHLIILNFPHLVPFFTESLISCL